MPDMEKPLVAPVGIARLRMMIVDDQGAWQARLARSIALARLLVILGSTWSVWCWLPSTRAW